MQAPKVLELLDKLLKENEKLKEDINFKQQQLNKAIARSIYNETLRLEPSLFKFFNFTKEFFDKFYDDQAAIYRKITHGANLVEGASLLHIYNDFDIHIETDYKTYCARLKKSNNKGSVFETYLKLNESVIIHKNKIYKLINDNL